MAMRVLITSPGLVGHIHPMVPLAEAIEARGHEVRWATTEVGVVHVDAAGQRGVAVSAFVMDPAEVHRRFPELGELAPPDVPDVMFGKVFGAMAAPPMLEGLVALVGEWSPDLVVSDAAELAGHVVAAELGVPSVTKGFGAALPEHRVARAAEEVAPLWRLRGLEPRPYGGSYDHLYLDPYPPALAVEPGDHVPRRQLVRPVAGTGLSGNTPAESVPVESLPLPGGPADVPIVYVTMGTVFNDVGPLRVVLAALADLPVRVLVTVGPNGDPDALGDQPLNVRVERYVPQAAVLPHCELVVSHGGSGTVLSTLALGIPQLCLPQGADQFLNAAAVAASGAGLALTPAEASIETVAEAIGRLLTGASYREEARRVGASIEAMPSADEVVGVLETLV
jgi:UDP:flavonoid glycosyltransferase YjiC (YdhE family)